MKLSRGTVVMVDSTPRLAANNVDRDLAWFGQLAREELTGIDLGLATYLGLNRVLAAPAPPVN